MIKIFTFLLCIILLASCEVDNNTPVITYDNEFQKTTLEVRDNYYGNATYTTIKTIDSCEYIVSRTSHGFATFCHKGNCKFCKERNN